jgi:hypothetical protein
MRRLFELTQSQEATTKDGQLQRPWTVVLFGVLASLAILGVFLFEARHGRPLSDLESIGLMAFAGIAFLMSVFYAYLGARHSRQLARRVTGAIGGIAIVGGVAVIVYSVLTMMP